MKKITSTIIGIILLVASTAWCFPPCAPSQSPSSVAITGGTVTGSIDNVNGFQVLTPSLQGIWYTSVSEDGGYDPNSVTQTVLITKS